MIRVYCHVNRLQRTSHLILRLTSLTASGTAFAQPIVGRISICCPTSTQRLGSVLRPPRTVLEYLHVCDAETRKGSKCRLKRDFTFHPELLRVNGDNIFSHTWRALKAKPRTSPYSSITIHDSNNSHSICKFCYGMSFRVSGRRRERLVSRILCVEVLVKTKLASGAM